MKKNEQPVLGVQEGEEHEQLQALQEEQAKRRIEIMDQLDEIKVPIICTVVMEPGTFDYRNRAFWVAFQQKDKNVRNLLTEFLNKNKSK